MLRTATVRIGLADLIFVKNLDRPMLGVVCDLLRAQVTAKKDSVMLRSTAVRI